MPPTEWLSSLKIVRFIHVGIGFTLKTDIKIGITRLEKANKPLQNIP